MTPQLPSLSELGIRVPVHLKPERFTCGFNHALKGGQLDKVEYFRLSFREGYRLGKLYLRAVRRVRGVLQFPMKAKVRFRAMH
jgi:hypothetical protein